MSYALPDGQVEATDQPHSSVQAHLMMPAVSSNCTRRRLALVGSAPIYTISEHQRKPLLPADYTSVRWLAAVDECGKVCSMLVCRWQPSLADWRQHLDMMHGHAACASLTHH
jgi:hypothetical protein